VNGDPSNDNINGTQFEVDPLSNQLRAGGDITGLFDTLDYLQGMGIKVSTFHPLDIIRLTLERDSTSPEVLSSISLGLPTAIHRST
jgi:alpha-1,3-glucan synthase